MNLKSKCLWPSTWFALTPKNSEKKLSNSLWITHYAKSCQRTHCCNTLESIKSQFLPSALRTKQIKLSARITKQWDNWLKLCQQETGTSKYTLNWLVLTKLLYAKSSQCVSTKATTHSNSSAFKCCWTGIEKETKAKRQQFLTLMCAVWA